MILVAQPAFRPGNIHADSVISEEKRLESRAGESSGHVYGKLRSEGRENVIIAVPRFLSLSLCFRYSTMLITLTLIPRQRLGNSDINVRNDVAPLSAILIALRRI